MKGLRVDLVIVDEATTLTADQLQAFWERICNEPMRPTPPLVVHPDHYDWVVGFIGGKP